MVKWVVLVVCGTLILFYIKLIFKHLLVECTILTHDTAACALHFTVYKINTSLNQAAEDASVVSSICTMEKKRCCNWKVDGRMGFSLVVVD